jgi:hypothetical protein
MIRPYGFLALLAFCPRLIAAQDTTAALQPIPAVTLSLDRHGPAAPPTGRR